MWWHAASGVPAYLASLSHCLTANRKLEERCGGPSLVAYFSSMRLQHLFVCLSFCLYSFALACEFSGKCPPVVVRRF
jgi:hypothetical protein